MHICTHTHVCTDARTHTHTHLHVPGYIFLGVIEGLLLMLQDGGDARQLPHHLRVRLPQSPSHHPSQLPQATLPPCEAKVLVSDGEAALDDMVEIVATRWATWSRLKYSARGTLICS